MKIAKKDIWLLRTNLDFEESVLRQIYVVIYSREHRKYYLPTTNNVYAEQGTKVISGKNDHRSTFEVLYVEFPEDACKYDVGNYVLADATIHSNTRELVKLEPNIDLETKFNNLVGDKYGVVDFEEIKKFQAFLDSNLNLPAIKKHLETYTKYKNCLSEETDARAQYYFFDFDFKKKRNSPELEK